MNSNRRDFLGTAMLGAGGLAGLTQLARAEMPAFGPGDGGFGHNVQQLPPGEAVVHHKAGDVDAMPDFHYSLDGSKPKVTSGGWAKEATVEGFPISKGIAGVHMFLDPGASRELHWHAIAAEWAYVIEGQCQIMVIDPNGTREVANFGPGDIWYFPKGHGHSIQTIGDKPCHFILSFDNGAFSEHGTFSITDWVSLTPPDILAENFGVPKELFAKFPKGETYIMAGEILTPQNAKEYLLPPAQSHKFSLLQQQPTHEFPGGTLYLATAKEFPVSQGMSGGLMTIKPGGLRELHWHPNANEWHYYLRGQAQVLLFGSGGRGKVADFKPGDVAYLPAGYGHAIRNTGTEDLEIILTFDSGHYEEISLTDWVAASPPHLLANNFGVPADTFKKFPTHSNFFRLPA
jgi:oxalate decarboxylase